jgi:integration host factor subunit beta
MHRPLGTSGTQGTSGTKGTQGTLGTLFMTKAELVEEVSRVSDLTKKHSEVIVDTVFESIIDALKRGEKIELRGFGSFRLRKREPRKGRNPKTGDKVDVPPKRVPYFKPGKELKDLINKETGEEPGSNSDLGSQISDPS